MNFLRSDFPASVIARSTIQGTGKLSAGRPARTVSIATDATVQSTAFAVEGLRK
jgi:hypothetical protein